MTKQEYENEIKELRERLEKLEATKIEEPLSKRWTPKNNESYLVICSDGKVGNPRWTNDGYDNWCYLIGNCFQTEEKAEEYKKKLEYTARYKNYIEEHSKPLDWNNRFQEKYYASYNFADKKIFTDYAYNLKNSDIYASSEQIIEDAIKEIGEDNFKKYVLEVK